MEKKTSAFYMRASKDDKIQIGRLARRLKVSKTEAVRRAVVMALNKTESIHPQPINQPVPQV